HRVDLGGLDSDADLAERELLVRADQAVDVLPAGRIARLRSVGLGLLGDAAFGSGRGLPSLRRLRAARGRARAGAAIARGALLLAASCRGALAFPRAS